MAILKIIKHGSTTAALRGVLNYVLDSEKTEDSLCAMIGDFENDDITPNGVYRDFMRVRKLFGKDNGGRIYLHGTIAFPYGEMPPEQVVSFVTDYCRTAYPCNQVLVAAHTDANHPHAHFIVQTVSFLDGRKLHESKADLEKQKQLVNAMCAERGLTIAQKGCHADGTPFAAGGVTIWSKGKYQQLKNDPKGMLMVALLEAIHAVLPSSSNKQEFCAAMEHEHGWSVIWEDTKKHIAFVNPDGKRFRDSNLEKTFHTEISKEAFQKQFAENEATKRRTVRRPRDEHRGRSR